MHQISSYIWSTSTNSDHCTKSGAISSHWMPPVMEIATLLSHPKHEREGMFRNLTEKLAEELQKQLADKGGLLPARELHLALQAALSRLDLVTREEFDAQAAVLGRTRQKLEELERQLIEMEQP